MTLTGPIRSRTMAFVVGIAAGLWLHPRLPAASEEVALQFHVVKRAKPTLAECRAGYDPPIHVYSADDVEAFRFGVSSCRKWRLWVRDGARVRVAEDRWQGRRLRAEDGR